jgi:hypothetical protein
MEQDTAHERMDAATHWKYGVTVTNSAAQQNCTPTSELVISTICSDLPATKTGTHMSADSESLQCHGPPRT